MDIEHDRFARGNAVIEALDGVSDTRNDQIHRNEDEDLQETSDPELDSWDPMSEDYSNLAFNAYREPTTAELRHWMPKPGNSGPSKDSMACYRSKDGDVRLFINGIPNEMTQEGVKGLFSQVGKVVYCKAIPQRDPSRIDKFGFVGYNSYREAEHAIRKFDGFSLGNNMKLRVSLAKERPKFPTMPSSTAGNFTHTNGLEEKLENDELDWGPPATPLNLTTSVNGDSTVEQDQQGDLKVPHKSSNTEASECNGKFEDTLTVEDASKPASKKLIAARIDPLPCSKCGEEGRRRCSNCKIPYCSRECQRLHWPEHKKLCHWKTKEESSPSSKFSSEETTSPDNSRSHVATDKESQEQSSSKRESSPIQDPYSLNDEDLEFTEMTQFADFLGIKVVPQSPRESPSSPAQNLTSNDRRSSLTSPQESHYGYLKPLKKASPKPLITEIKSSLASECEPVVTEGQDEGSSSSTSRESHVTASIDASSAVTNPHIKEQPKKAPGYDKTAEEPSNRPYKRYYINEVPHENLSVGGSYEIVATSVSSPSLFWAQLYEASTLASQNYLFETIKAEYENTAYKTYVPSANELCIAQFSLDSNWYRSKVDYIGNNGLIRVTHIDFGSSEDVEPSKIRRIKEELVHIPRQALKCALHLPGCSELTRGWSPETFETFKSKVLDVKCRVEVKDVKDSVVYLDVYDSIDNTKINDIVREKQELEKTTLHRPVPEYPQSSQTVETNKCTEEEISLANSNNPRRLSSETLEQPSLSKAEGHSKSSSGRASPSFAAQVSTRAETEMPGTSRKDNTSPVLQNYSSDVPTRKVSSEGLVSADNASFQIKSHSTGPERAKCMEPSAQGSQGFPREMQTSPETTYKTPLNPNPNAEPEHRVYGKNVLETMSDQESASSTSERSVSSHRSSKSSSESDLQVKSPEPLIQRITGIVHGLPFKAVVTSVKSPWEFTVKLSDPQFTAQLEKLTNDLNMYCSTAPCEVDKLYSYGDLCAVKLSEDQTWHRGKVLANFQQEGYKINLADKGGYQIVPPQNIRSIPDQFKVLEPQCRLCSLGGVRKPARSLVWGKEASERFSSLVLYRTFTLKEISRFKQSHIVELLDEAGQPSVATELITAGLADAYVKKVQRTQDFKGASQSVPAKALPLHFKSAIKMAPLPPPNTTFQVMATEIKSPGCFFVQLTDKETNQRLSELCLEMNKYYADSTPLPDWKPREAELCAAFFKGSWFRAYVESVDQDNAAKIYCVDFGNSEVVSTSVVRPLAPTFQTLPQCALRCSLGNIAPVEGEEWPQEVTELIKMKMPMSSSLNARLIYKGQLILFLDVFVSSGKGTESLINLIVGRGLAKYKVKKDVKSPSTTAGVSRDRIEDKVGPYKSGISPYSLSVYGCAIAAAKLPNDMETFEGVVTEVTSSGELFIQVAEEVLAVQLMQLTNAMNSYYSKASPTKFEAKQNLLCAAKFSTDWRRAYILEVHSDQTAKVYDVDFGRTEVMPVSQLQFLQPQFTSLQYFALRCKLALPKGVNWSKEFNDIFLSEVKLLVPVTLKLYSKRREILFVDVFIPESRHSLRQMIMSQSQDRKPIEKVDGGSRNNFKHRKVPSDTRCDIKNINFEKALAAVNLPPNGEAFSAVVTEFQSPECFYIHSDVEMAKKLADLSADMNTHYNTVPRSSFQPIENQLCVAPFGSPNDWYRGLIEKITTEQIATVFFVDYGNTDEVPASDIRALDERFSSLPFCALHTSLANVKPVDSAEWSRDAIDFVKSKMTVGICLSFKLISKEQHTLYVDMVDAEQGMLCDDLIKKGMACYSQMRGEKSPSRFRSSPSQSSKRMSPTETAIASANVAPNKETFQVIATDITSPGCFAVQIADYEMACKVAALGKEMNSHYQSAHYPLFQPAANQLCAAQFTGNDEWYRGWVNGIVSDNKVHVYYLDYGNSEVLDVSRLRPLEKQFTVLPFSALACSIAHVVPADQENWKQEAIDLFISKVPLYQPINAQLVYKKRDRLFLDIIDPDDSSTTISKILVKQGLAVWMLPGKRQMKETNEEFQARPPYDESKKVKLVTNDTIACRETLPVPSAQTFMHPQKSPSPESQAQTTISPAVKNKHLLDTLPMVFVPKGEFFDAMVCDIRHTGAVSLQVLTKELKLLDELCVNVNYHCSQVDHFPYYPETGELCLACFSQDKNWYRAVVNDILPNDQCKVTFVDFGNADTLSPSEIRKIEPDFLGLHRQAYTGLLACLPLGSNREALLGDDIVKALNEKLLDKRVFARVNESTSEVEFCNVGPDEKPGTCINVEVFEKAAVKNAQSILTSVENEFMALVSEVFGTAEIWVQRKDALASLNNLKEDLSSYCESSNSVVMATVPQPGHVLFSKFSIDKKWYRAKVVQSNNRKSILVRFLDYGNTEEVSIEDLREAIPEFLQFPFQGIKCYLVGITQGNPDADEYVQQTLNRELTVKVCERRPDELGVELLDYGVPNGPFNINENLIAFGYTA